MLYVALASLSCALAATLLGYAALAIIFAQIGEIMFVFSALLPRNATVRQEAMVAA